MAHAEKHLHQIGHVLACAVAMKKPGMPGFFKATFSVRSLSQSTRAVFLNPRRILHRGVTNAITFIYSNADVLPPLQEIHSMQQHQYSLTLIQHQVQNAIVEQRTSDGYINATALCKAAGKRWHNYVRQETTGHFLRALEAKTRISVLELIQEVRDVHGIARTWVHPKVAIHLAQWLSADFAVQVSEWVYEWMDGKATPATGPVALPPHLQRYLSNDGNVPPGYFSVLQETGLNLFGPLHNVGFEIPKGWVPDISVGLKFCAHLREQHDVDTDTLPQYQHDYLDGRPPVHAKLYPEEHLPTFRRWFRAEWLPKHGVEYFKRKDPASLPYLDRLPALAAANQHRLPPTKSKKRAA